MDTLCADEGAFPMRQSNAMLLLAESVHGTGKSLCSTVGSISEAVWRNTAQLHGPFWSEGTPKDVYLRGVSLSLL